MKVALSVAGGGNGHGDSHGSTIGGINPRVIGDGVGKVQWQGPLSERSGG